MSALLAVAHEPQPDPQVTELEAGDDRIWFFDHPTRSFRVRPSANGTWLVRRRRQGADADVLLRTLSPGSASHDDDVNIGTAWYANAFGLETQAALKAARKLLRKAKPRGVR